MREPGLTVTFHLSPLLMNFNRKFLDIPFVTGIRVKIMVFLVLVAAFLKHWKKENTASHSMMCYFGILRNSHMIVSEAKQIEF